MSVLIVSKSFVYACEKLSMNVTILSTVICTKNYTLDNPYGNHVISLIFLIYFSNYLIFLLKYIFMYKKSFQDKITSFCLVGQNILFSIVSVKFGILISQDTNQ